MGVAAVVQIPARAARRGGCGGCPKARMKARRILSGSRKPVSSATRSIASLEDCTRSRATSIRSRSIAFEGAAKMPRAHAGAFGQILDRQSLVEMLARPGQQRPEARRRRLELEQRGE